MELNLEEFLKSEQNNIDAKAAMKKRKAAFIFETIAAHMSLMDKVVYFQPDNNQELHGANRVIDAYYDAVNSGIKALLRKYTGAEVVMSDTPYFDNADYPIVVSSPLWPIWQSRCGPGVDLEISRRLGWSELELLPKSVPQKIVIPPEVKIFDRVRHILMRPRIKAVDEKPAPDIYEMRLTENGRLVLNNYLSVHGQPDVETLRNKSIATFNEKLA